jgi:23S rRNA-intervening sequence protein
MALQQATSFKELRVYRKAREVSRAVFKLTKGFPKAEMYSLTDH